MNNMADGNTAALNRKMADDDRDERFMEMAKADRKRLVGEYVADPECNNEASLVDMLADLADEDPAILHGLQRIHVIAAKPLTPESSERIAAIAVTICKRFVDYVDHIEGDDIVNDEANRLARGAA